MNIQSYLTVAAINLKRFAAAFDARLPASGMGRARDKLVSALLARWADGFIAPRRIRLTSSGGAPTGRSSLLGCDLRRISVEIECLRGTNKDLTMNIIKYLFSVLVLVGALSQQAAAQVLSTDDLGFAFGSDMKSELNAMGYKQSDVVFMTEEEMLATEGEWSQFAVRAFIWANSVRRLWIRYGESFSRSGDFETYAIRWGSNTRYSNEISNRILRSWNQRLHSIRLPGNSWRTRDPGHFHIRLR